MIITLSGEQTFIKRQKAKVEIKGENAKCKEEEEEATGENNYFIKLH